MLVIDETGEVNLNVAVRIGRADIFSSKMKLIEKALPTLAFKIFDQAQTEEGTNACWTYNAVVDMDMSENSRPKEIFHMSYYEKLS